MCVTSVNLWSGNDDLDKENSAEVPNGSEGDGTCDVGCFLKRQDNKTGYTTKIKSNWCCGENSNVGLELVGHVARMIDNRCTK